MWEQSPVDRREERTRHRRRRADRKRGLASCQWFGNETMRGGIWHLPGARPASSRTRILYSGWVDAIVTFLASKWRSQSKGRNIVLTGRTTTIGKGQQQSGRGAWTHRPKYTEAGTGVPVRFSIPSGSFLLYLPPYQYSPTILAGPGLRPMKHSSSERRIQVPSSQ